MADNFVTDPGVGGATFASDDVVGVHYPLTKLVWGALDAVNLVDDATGKRLPIKVAEALPAGTNNIGDVDVVTLPADGTATGALTAPAQAVTLSLDNGRNAIAVQVTGTWTGQLEFEATVDGTTFLAHDTVNSVLGGIANATTVNGIFFAGTSGFASFRVRASALSVGTANVTIRSGLAPQSFHLESVLPAGDNNIGNVDVVTLPSIPAGTNNIGDVDVLTLPALSAGTNNIGDVDVLTLPPLPAGTNNIGDVDVLTLPALTTGDNTVGRVKITDGTDVALVSAAGALIVDGSGITQPVSGTVTANAGTGTFTVGGDVAHDTADSGNPVKMGGVARVANPTAVAGGDRVNAYFDDLGRQVIVSNGPRDLVTQNSITLTSGTETTLLASVASTFLDITELIMSNTSATLVRVDIRDATAGTVRLSVALAANGGGAVMHFDPPLKQTAVTNNWTAQLSGAVTDVRIFAQAVQNV